MISEVLIAKLLKFRAERDWEQFHNLRTLATSIVLEAAELAEITQWTADTDLAKTVDSRRDDIEAEVADIVILLTYLLHDLGIDLDASVARKLEQNAAKYPVGKARGRSTKYDSF